MLSALAGPLLLSCSLQRARPLVLKSLVVASQRSASSSALVETTKKKTLPLSFLLKSALPMLHHHRRSLLPLATPVYSASPSFSSRRHISMSSIQEASARKKEHVKESAFRGRRFTGARAVAADADAASSPPQQPSQPQPRGQRRQRSPPRPRPGAPKVVVLAGPTASGKSAVSLKLAGILNGEVVNADSVQVYRGLDVGSAKLPFEERQGVPHHLIDVAEPLSASPEEEFSAGAFYSLARGAIEEVLARGKVPIVVGGTGLYLRWLVHGRPSTKPTSDEGRRWARRAFDAAVAAAEAAKREGMGRASGEGGGLLEETSSSVLTKGERWAAACSALSAAGDPSAAERVLKEKNNEYRLLRALAALFEAGPGVTLASLEAPGLVGGVKSKKKGKEGKEDEEDEAGSDDDADSTAVAVVPSSPSSSSSSSSSPASPASSPASSSPPLLDYDFRCFFLHAPSREQAYRRIDARAETIVAGGLFEEAAELLSKGALPATNSATRAIGYRQAMEGLVEVLGRGEGEEDDKPRAGVPSPAPEDVRAVAAATQAASRRLAHSQYTWFRGDPLYRWVAVPVSSSSGEAEGAEENGEGGREIDPVSRAAEEVAASFALPEHDPSGKRRPPSCSSSPPPSSPSSCSPPSDGRLTKEEEQALRRYVPRLTLLSTDRGMRQALTSFSAAVSSVPKEVTRAARDEAAKRRRQRESSM